MSLHDDSFGSLSCTAMELDHHLKWHPESMIAFAITHNCTLHILQHLIDKGYSVNAKWLKKEPIIKLFFSFCILFKFPQKYLKYC